MQCFINSIDLKEWSRVHFIPDLKVGVFVTLRTPDVINRIFCPVKGTYFKADFIFKLLKSDA